MTETAKIAEALAAWQKEMPTVTKGKRADTGKYGYTYADLAAITAAAMPILTKHGLSFSCRSQRTDDGYELVGALLHTSGESLEGALPIYGHTSQEIGSSLTYNRRYLFGCLTGLVTDDDDDGAAANATTRRTGKREPKQPPANQLNLAKTEVYDAWKATREWDADAMAKEFEQFAAVPVSEGTVDQFRGFAAQLRGESS